MADFKSIGVTNWIQAQLKEVQKYKSLTRILKTRIDKRQD